MDSKLVFGEETDIQVAVSVPVSRMKSAFVFWIQKAMCVLMCLIAQLCWPQYRYFHSPES